jgi:hypothetical protein
VKTISSRHVFVSQSDSIRDEGRSLGVKRRLRCGLGGPLLE